MDSFAKRRWLGMEDKNLQGELMLLQYIKDILEEPQKAKLET